MPPDYSIQVRFHLPPDDLRRYFTTFYIAEFDPGSAGTLCDSLHPEWGGMRFFSPNSPDARTDRGQRVSGTRFVAQGPTSHPIHFSIPKTRMWGFGLLPLGWARYIGLPAADFADRVLDGFEHPDCAPFRPLAESLFAGPPDEAAELARLVAFFRAFKAAGRIDEKRILAFHDALVDPALNTVHELVERVAASQRTVERLSHRHFGFPPKLLLRRQRFMRSLAQFMVDPSLKWIGALDGHYHDQAQFVRDFHEFMGMTPREYSSTPHPVLERFVQERTRAHGTGVQTLDRPDGAVGGAS
ncbi:MAG: helix-turn-helix domain-containing protein [Sphingomonadaceae bacterium]